MTTPWRSRLARADRHLEEVEREVDRFLATQPYRVVGQTERHPLVPNMLKHIVRGYVDRRPDPSFADVVGDFIENVRSCLDLLAYALAGSSGQPPGGTEFPVFWNPSDYLRPDRRGEPARGSGLYKVRGMASTAQTVIERLQPYQGLDPTDFTVAGPGVVPESIIRHPLYLAHNLRTANFHREPHVTGAISSGLGIGVGNVLDVRATINPQGTALEVGAFHEGASLLVLQFVITGPNPVVEMNLNPTFDVAFDPEGPARGQPVVATLRSLRDHVENVIFPELEPLVV